MNKTNFSRMKQVSKAEALSIDVDNLKADWDSYLEIEEEEHRKKKTEKRYKKGGPRRNK